MTSRTDRVWRNRIVGQGVKPASQFVANARNWRTHPRAQRAALQGALNEVGWIAPVVENIRTGRLVDGHERVWQALQNGDTDVPFVQVDLSEEEEAYALLTLDPIGAMAQASADQLGVLLAEVQSSEAGVQQMLTDLAEHSGVLDQPADGDGGDVADDAPPSPHVERWQVPDASFATDNEWGVPLLDLGLQARTLDNPVTKWGTVKRGATMRGTYHFYTDDYKFEALWKDPAPVINSGCASVVEPNFSTGEQMPLAVGLWGVFRKRWLARWWQTFGVRVFVDLNVEPHLNAINLLGVPQGWGAYATRWLDKYGVGDVEEQYRIAQERSGLDAPLFVVFGGRAAAERACMDHGWVWVREHAAEVNDGQGR